MKAQIISATEGVKASELSRQLVLQGLRKEQADALIEQISGNEAITSNTVLTKEQTSAILEQAEARKLLSAEQRQNIANDIEESASSATEATAEMAQASSELAESTAKVGTTSSILARGVSQLETGMKSLLSIFVSSPTAIIATLTGSIIGLTYIIGKFQDSAKNAAKAASDFASSMSSINSTYNQETQTLNELTEKYQDLREQLIAAKGNEEETYSIKSQMLELQKQLNEIYGDEYDKVNLVTDAYRDQTDELKKNAKQKAENYLNENYDKIEEAKDKLLSERTYELGNFNYGLQDADLGNELHRQIKQLAKDSGIEWDDKKGFVFKGTAEDASKAINQFMTDVTNLKNAQSNLPDSIEENLSAFSSSMSKQLGYADEIIKGYQETYETAQMAQIASDTNLSKGYNQAIDAVEKYNDAVLRSENPYDDKNVKKAWDNLQTIKNGIKENEAEWGQYSNIMDDVFSTASDDAYSFYQTMQNDDSVSKLVDDLQGLSDTDLQSMADDGVEDSFDKLCQKANEYGLEVQDVIDLLLQLGIAQGKVEESVQNETNILSFSDAWEQLKNSAEDATKGLADNLTELAEKGRLTAETFSQTDTSGYFENLGISADDATKQINALVSSSTQLQSMSEQISKMSDMLADKKNGTTASASDLAGFDATVKGLESWEEFERVMGSSKSSMEECQAAANALATEWVNNGNFLANLTEENKDYYTHQLKSMGIENAASVVTESLTGKKEALRLKYLALNAVLTDFEGKTNGACARLLEQENASDQTRSALADLVTQEILFNNSSLDVSGKISALNQLALAAYGVSDALTSGMGLDSRYYNGKTTEERAAEKMSILSSAQKVTSSQISISPTGSQNYKPTGGTDKKKKEKPQTGLVDFYEKKINSLNNQLDVLGEKYENIFSIKKKKDNLDEQIDKLKELSKVSDTAAKRYRKQANKITFFKDSKKDAEFKEKIRNGSYNITRYDQDTINKIQRYEDYIGKAEDAESQSRTAKTQEREKQKDKNQLDIDTAQQRKDWLDAEIENTGNSEKKIRLLKKQRTEIGKIYDGEIANAKLEHNSVKVKELQAEKQKELTDNTISQYQLDADNAEAKIAKSQALAALDEGNYKKQNKRLEAQKKYLREQYDAQIKIAEAEGNTLEVERLRAELLKELRDKAKEQFDNIDETYSLKIGFTENKKNAIQDQISLLEAQGQKIGSRLYTKQIELNNVNLGRLKQELIDQTEELAHIGKKTPEWYATQDAIFATEKAIDGIITENANLQKSINQLKFDNFDNLLTKLDDVTSEIDFIVGMLDSENLFDDNGKITDDGLTAVGLTAEKYDVLIAKAQKLKEEQADIEQMYAKGDLDPETYESKMREITKSRQDTAKSIKDSEKAIKSYVEQGLNKQNEALEKEIENRKKLLRQQKTDLDFKKSLEKKNKEIARLETQIAVTEGDTSDENKKNLRELRSRLQDLKDERDDTLYERSISDQEDALDTMLENSKKQTEDYLKDSNKVLMDAFALVNTNTSQVANNLEKISEDLGYDISKNITDAWKDGGKAVDSYANILQGSVPKINLQIESITTKWKEACKAAEEAANATVNATEGRYTNHTTVGADPKVLSDIEWYINKNGDTPKNKPSSHSALNQYIYEKTGKVIAEDKQAGLAKILGINGIGKDTNASDRSKILKALKDAGFSSGGVINARSVGEDGFGLVKHEEAVLTKPQWQSIRDLGTALTNMNYSLYKPYIPKFETRNAQSPVYNIDSSITVEGIATNEIVRDMANVAKKQAEDVVAEINRRTYTKGVRR